MNAQLVWVVKKGRNERELELWCGPKKVCGFKDLKEERLLEEIVEAANERDEILGKLECLKEKLEVGVFPDDEDHVL